MNFEQVRIVLVETSHPGNIGSSARAMKNMGFSSLYLVQPKYLPHPEANELSAGSEDVLMNAVVVPDLKTALQGCHVVLMMSARGRAIGLSGFTPREAAEHIASLPETYTVALVFGRERIGLTNEELLLGHYHVMVPANPAYASLNLSQAVQILTYELRMQLLKPQVQVEQHKDQQASHEAVELFYAHLFEVLTEIGFLKPHAPKRLEERVRRLFGRVQLETLEVSLLRGMLKRIQYQQHDDSKRGSS